MDRYKTLLGQSRPFMLLIKDVPFLQMQPRLFSQTLTTSLTVTKALGIAPYHTNLTRNRAPDVSTTLTSPLFLDTDPFVPYTTNYTAPPSMQFPIMLSAELRTSTDAPTCI